MRPMIWAERFGKSFVRIESNNNIMKRIVTVAVIALFLFLGGQHMPRVRIRVFP